MSARPQDYISASGFTIRDDVAGSANKLSISGSSVSVPVPAVLTVGARIKVTTKPAGLVAYYRITTATIGALQTGVSLEWIDVGVAPATVVLTAGDTVEFVPYATGKAAIPQQNVKVGRGHSIELLDYFQMIGGRDKDLTFFARPGGAFAKVSTSGSALVIAGNSVGTMSVTVTAQDKSQGRYAQSFTIVVAQANRAPVSSKAIGNPTIAVGATVTYDLNDYFTDPDGDALAFSSGSINHNPLGTVAGAVVAISIPGSTLTLTGLIQGSTRFTVGASDGDLTISQQVNVTVPANQRPIIDQHIPGLAVALDGQPITVPLDAYFTDPDGTALAYLIQFEQGDPTKQYEQEIWYPHTQSGSSQLAMDSEFAYPPGSVAPWGTGTPWIVPAGTDFTMRGTYAGTLTTHRLTTRASANATWHTGTRKVRLTLTFTTALPTGPSTTHLLALLGKGADVCWSDVAGQTLTLAPGESPGHRTLYIEAYDAGGLAASQFAVITLGRAPSVTPIADVEVITGADVVLRLADYFTDPDADSLTYNLIPNVHHIVTASFVDRQVVTAGSISTETDLHIHGLTAGDVVLTLTATDSTGLSVTTTINVQVTPSVVLSGAPMISPAFLTDLATLYSDEGVSALVVESVDQSVVPYPPGAWKPINPRFTLLPGDRTITTAQTDKDGDDRLRLVALLAGKLPVPWRAWGREIDRGSAGITQDSRLEVGDRFRVSGYPSATFEIAEILSSSPGYIASADGNSDRVVQDVRLTENPKLTTAQDSWYWDGWKDVIVWLPKTVTAHVPITILPTATLPGALSTIAETIANQLIRIPYANMLAVASVIGRAVETVISAGSVLRISNVEYLVDTISLRSYHDSPLFFEANLQAVAGSPTAPVTPPTNGGNGTPVTPPINGGNGATNGGQRDACFWR